MSIVISPQRGREEKDTMMVRGEKYMLTLKTSQMIPRARDLFFLEWMPLMIPVPMAAVKTAAHSSSKQTFF